MSRVSQRSLSRSQQRARSQSLPSRSRSPDFGAAEPWPRELPLPYRWPAVDEYARRLGPPPAERPPSPPAEPQGGNAAQWAWGGLPAPTWDPPQFVRVDTHPDHTGYEPTKIGHIIALMLNAMFDSAGDLDVVPALVDFHWHAPDKDDVQPLGYNERGDMAPPSVHSLLDSILAELDSPLETELELVLMHGLIDSIWFLHSRSPARCKNALRRVRILRDKDVDLLDVAMRAEPLTDGRYVLLPLDAREVPVYGRTKHSAGQSRLFRHFHDVVAGPDDHEKWDNDNGGGSGSSDEDVNNVLPFGRTPEQTLAHEQRLRERRLRRLHSFGEKAERELRRLEDAMRTLEDNLKIAFEQYRLTKEFQGIIEAGLRSKAKTNAHPWKQWDEMSPPPR